MLRIILLISGLILSSRVNEDLILNPDTFEIAVKPAILQLDAYSFVSISRRSTHCLALKLMHVADVFQVLEQFQSIQIVPTYSVTTALAPGRSAPPHVT